MPLQLRSLLPLLLATVFNITAWGQPLKHLHHYSYNINEGLLHSQVTSAAYDGNGFLWISTGNGLQKFDGNNFSQVPVSGGSKGIPDDKYVTLFPLRNGNLLLAHSKGISEYNINSDRFTHYTMTGNDRQKVWLLMEEQGNDIWSLSLPGSFYLLDKHKMIVKDSIFFPKQAKVWKAFMIKSGKQDNYFIGFNDTMIYILNKRFPACLSYSPGKLQHRFFDIVEYRPDSLLVASERGIEKMSISSGKFELVCRYVFTEKKDLTSEYIRMHRLPSGNYLVSEGNKVYELNIDEKKYVAKLVDMQGQHFLSRGLVTGFFTDRYENCWIRTMNEGLHKINYGPGFKYYGTPDKRKNFVKTIYADKQNNIVLCGTMGSGLLVFDTARQLLKEIGYFSGLPSPNTVSAIYKIADHEFLFFMTGNWHVYKLNTRSFKLDRVNVDTNKVHPAFVADYHMTLHRAGNTEIIMQNSFFVYRLRWQAPLTLHFESGTELPTASIGSFRDGRNRLWVGGRWKYFLFNETTNYFREFDLPERWIVRCFYETKINELWMGTEKGLYQLNDEGKIIRTVYKTDGLPDDNIYALAGDKYGNMWISHNKGISCMRKAGDYIHYYKSDGLQENEFNTNSVFTTADGELFFGGVNGVSSFYPESILKLSQAPGLLVTGLKIKDVEWSGDTAVWNLQHLQLPYFKNDLSIEFTALGMRTPEQYNYQYRMLGLEENWINSANHRAARYVLPPGTYTFELSAQGSFNKDAVASRRIKITIQPPFWQTKLFLFSAFVLLAAIVILLTRYFSGLKLKRRIEQLERKRAIDEERLRISREMHDDLGSGLTQITMLSESAKGKTFNDEQLEKIASTSRKLVTDMSEIIWSMNPSQVSAGHLFAYLREQLHGLLESSGISYTIDFPEQGLDYELNNGQKRNLLLVTKEIVHNAIKHSGSNRVNVSAIIKNKNLEFTVADNGHGFHHSLHHNGNGLKNIKRRIEELKGHLDIESSANGSRFFYRIPLQV